MLNSNNNMDRPRYYNKYPGYRNNHSTRQNDDSSRRNNYSSHYKNDNGYSRRNKNDNGYSRRNNYSTRYDNDGTQQRQGYSYDRNRNRNRNNHYHNRNRYNYQNKTNHNSYFRDRYTKEEILTYIYDTLDISKYRYELLENDNDKYKIRENNYYISPNYNGINSLLVFIKMKDKYYSFLVDRKTLSYNISQLNVDRVKIIPINIRFDPTIYNGTIIDGVLLYNNAKFKEKIFIINDLYYFCGRNMLSDKIINKMYNVSAYIKNTYVKDNNLNNITLVVNKLYEKNDIKKLISVHIPKSKFKYAIKGIAYHPDFSSTKLIYLFNNCSKQMIKNDIETKSIVKKMRASEIIIKDGITAIFRIKKTETPDVYWLYLMKRIKRKEKNFIRYKKYGIAYVPTSKCSYFCKDMFDVVDSETTLVKCKYSLEKNKWIPYEHVMNKKYPDAYDDVENNAKP